MILDERVWTIIGIVTMLGGIFGIWAVLKIDGWISRARPIPKSPTWEAVEANQQFVTAVACLTADEGDSVTILSQNPEGTGPDNHAIDCCGAWTDWQDRRTSGRTVLEALMVAAAARAQYDAAH